MIQNRLSMTVTHFVTYIFVFSNVAQAQSSLLPKTADTITEASENVITDKHFSLNYTKTNSYNENNNFNDKCILKVSNESKFKFTKNILKYRYNFVYLKLNFSVNATRNVFAKNFSVNATQNVIAKNDWIWTYKGDDGAHQYLYISEDFGYLSFGLLWAHTMKERMSVDIEITGDCNVLTIGEEKYDILIGEALGNMTSEIALKDEMYISSYWCYNKRVWIRSWVVYELCKNSVCTFQTIEYGCCQFHFDYATKNRTIKCQTEHYYYGAIWWVLPIITGNICFAYYPLILTKIGMKFKKMSKSMKKERSTSMPSFPDRIDSDDSEIINKSNYISLKSSNPITVFSTLFLSFYGLVLDSSRVLRIWIIIFPMCLSAIHVSLDYVYANDFMVSAVQKGALVGFSAILAGANEARRNFIYIFGGPIVAISICILFGCLLIVFPSNLEDFVATGIAGHEKKYLSLIRMPLKLKEKISGIKVRHHKGCKRLHRLFLAQIFMLIHSKFWKQSIKLFFLRWKYIIFIKMNKISENTIALVISCVVFLPFYIVLCICELILSVLYYLFPVVNCFIIVLNSVRIHYNDWLHQRGLVSRCFRYIMFVPMLVLFSISWYTYSITFFDGFWFLSRIVMFTYSGIVAYPHLSYGYLVLTFMTLFYVTESINAFGESYKDLLKVSLESCEKFQHKHIDDVEFDPEDIQSIRTKYGIKTDLFYVIVKKNLPRRNQLLITILKLTSVITILIVSVELLATFDKFKELSLVMHIFSVLFVCALPKIIHMMCWKNRKEKARIKMKKKVFRTITDYVRNKKIYARTSTNDEHDNVFVSRHSGYETFTDNVTDNV